MKTPKSITRLAGACAAALLIAALPQTAFAVASGITVSNTATVDYEVNSVAQPQKNASVNFVTDKKVDVLVENLDGAAITVAPGQTTVVLKFRVTNQGNDVQDMRLTATALSGGAAKYGGTDNFDATAFKIYLDANANETWDGTGTETDVTADAYVDELAAAGTRVVFLVGNIPSAQGDASIASYFLEAQVGVGGTGSSKGAAETATGDGTADTPGSVDIVFADSTGDNSDAARDGKHTLQGEWKVAGATLTVTKSSVVISDGISASNFKRIPGAVVEYRIDIDNTGGSDATNVTIADDLTGELANITFAVGQYNTATDEIEITADIDGTPSITTYTQESDGDTGDYGVTTANTVTVSGLTVAAGTKTRVAFRVTID